jgi:SIR2-like domain
LDNMEFLEILQEFMRKKPIVIVGSGLSMSMGLPGMDKLLKHLKLRIPTYYRFFPNIEKEWGHCVKLIDAYGLEEGLGKTKINEKLLSIILDETASMVEKEDESLRQKLLAKSDYPFPFVKLLKHLMTSLHPSDPVLDIVTSNYDHVIEYACDRARIKCSVGFSGVITQEFTSDDLNKHLYTENLLPKRGRLIREFRKEKRVRLLKPHGSLWWQKIGDATLQSSTRIPSGSRVLITPGLTKYEVSLTDNVMNYHREKANECIRKANAILVIGYGFNDTHLQTVLNERLSDGLDSLFLSKSLTANAKKIIAKFHQVAALEANEGGTEWYCQGNTGIFADPIWDLATFIDKVI